jgi:hypothetical protein
LFYHQDAYSPKFDKNRAICIDSLSFNTDGTIRKVTPTLRGVGVTKATTQIEIDRFSKISESGVKIAFLDSTNTFNGWKAVFNNPNTWVQHNSVDFGKGNLKKVMVKAMSETGSTLQICLDKADGPVIAEVKVPKGKFWNTVEAKVSKQQTGIHNLVVVLKSENQTEVDWVQFK